MMDVRAYYYAGRTLVQYFDSGDSSTLQCPECSWEGRIWEVFSPYVKTAKEVQCPCCQATLASFSRVGADAEEALGVIPKNLRARASMSLLAA